MASRENWLLSLVSHGRYLYAVWGPLFYCSSSDSGALSPSSATLFLSRKPESNSSHMSVIKVESDEPLMKLNVFLLCFIVYFSLFRSINCCPKGYRRGKLLKYSHHNHKSHEKYLIQPEMLSEWNVHVKQCRVFKVKSFPFSSKNSFTLSVLRATIGQYAQRTSLKVQQRENYAVSCCLCWNTVYDNHHSLRWLD